MACKPHVAYNTGQNEWYTPQSIIDLVYSVMGHIDIDVASSAKANEVVRADEYFSAENNGLEHHWHGKIFMNPPYSAELIKKFIGKFCAERLSIDEAIIVVNNATETEWFQQLVKSCNAIVFPKNRMRFYSPDGRIAHPLQGQAIMYAGNNSHRFIEVFSKIGFGVILT